MEDLSLHILDVAENSIDAGAGLIVIALSENDKEDSFSIRITDDGKGMDEEMIKKVLDPFFTTKTVRRFGLGIPLLEQSCRESGGGLSIESAEGKGTAITAEFRKGHIDRKPLGDMGATMMTLIGGHPEIDFELRYEKNGDTDFILSTRELRMELDGVPLNEPAVLKYIKENVNEALQEVY
ncbi:MAG: ATP-binding protein [Nitrospirae bacterium]|nr:MAG: ATP-binding protein [Nitrospirota bacterium]